ncbi:FTR1 family protein [Candidatus Micrarchaeota archaeon]|nr:FTR1 family protein [Candidatus Micrarchaeota archaeon]
MPSIPFMIAEFIVMFRESLEVAFVIGIILAYLHKTKNQDQEKHVWLGVCSGILISIALVFAFQALKIEFEDHEEIFEGFFMITTAALVSWLILWVVKQKKIVENLQSEVKVVLEKNGMFGLFLLALTATLRESVESVLFMAGIYINAGAISLLGGFLGIAAAVIVGILVFEYAVRFNIGLFFKATTVILVLLTAGLFSQGLHELQEAKVLPEWIEHVYDINPPQNPDGTYPLLHEKGAIGGVFKGLIGYDGDPSDLQVAGYLAYVAVMYAVYKRN